MNFKHIFLSILALVICSTIEIKASKKSAKRDKADDRMIIYLPEGALETDDEGPLRTKAKFSVKHPTKAMIGNVDMQPGKNVILKKLIHHKNKDLDFIEVWFAFTSSGMPSCDPHEARQRATAFGCTIINPCWNKKYTVRPLWVMNKNECSPSPVKNSTRAICLQRIAKESALKTPEYYQKIRNSEGTERLSGDYCREGEIFSRSILQGYFPCCYTVQDIDPSDLDDQA